MAPEKKDQNLRKRDRQMSIACTHKAPWQMEEKDQNLRNPSSLFFSVTPACELNVPKLHKLYEHHIFDYGICLNGIFVSRDSFLCPSQCVAVWHRTIIMFVPGPNNIQDSPCFRGDCC